MGHSGSFTVGDAYGGRGGGKVFDQDTLRHTGVCRFSYYGVGSPLLMTLKEGGVATTCELATWEPEVVDDIPIARDSIVVKIIMKVWR